MTAAPHVRIWYYAWIGPIVLDIFTMDQYIQFFLSRKQGDGDIPGFFPDLLNVVLQSLAVVYHPKRRTCKIDDRLQMGIGRVFYAAEHDS